MIWFIGATRNETTEKQRKPQREQEADPEAEETRGKARTRGNQSKTKDPRKLTEPEGTRGNNWQNQNQREAEGTKDNWREPHGPDKKTHRFYILVRVLEGSTNTKALVL